MGLEKLNLKGVDKWYWQCVCCGSWKCPGDCWKTNPRYLLKPPLKFHWTHLQEVGWGAVLLILLGLLAIRCS